MCSECRRAAEEACAAYNRRDVITGPLATEIGKPEREHEIVPIREPVPSRDVPAVEPDYDPEPLVPERVTEPVEPLVPA